MLGDGRRRGTTKPDIVVAIIGVVVVAISGAEVVRIIVPRPAAQKAPFIDRSPFLAGKQPLPAKVFSIVLYSHEPHVLSKIELIDGYAPSLPSLFDISFETDLIFS